MKKSERPTMTSVGRAFRTIIWPRRKLLVFGLVLLVINKVSAMVLPTSTKFLIDDVIPNRDTELLRRILWIVGAAVTVQAVTSFVLTRMLSVQAQYLITELRRKVQQHVLHLPVGYFDRVKSGDLVSRVMRDVEGVRNLVGTGLVQLVGGLIVAAIALVLLIRIDPKLTAIALVPLVLFSLISMAAFKKIRPIFRERGKIMARVTGRLVESFGGIRVVKGFNAEETEKEVFSEGVEELFDNVRRTMTTTAAVTSLATLLMGVASVSIMGVGVGLIIDDALTVGEFFAFTFYLAFLVTPIVQMSNIGTQMTEAFAGLDRTEELLNVEREGEEPGRTHEFGPIEGEIRFEGVSFGYSDDTDVLHEVDMVAAPGTVTAFVGSSGSGKTTMAGLAAAFLMPKRGVVRVDGVDLAGARLESYRKQLGLVLQDDFLFDGTIRENILFARPGATEEALLEAVRSAHVKEFVDEFKDGLETVIGERGVKLSGGQRQRVAIARALLADPRVLVLDEATSNLDTETEAYIQESLAHLMKGRTTLVIAHRLSTIERADQILVLEEGRIVERGAHAELLAKKGRYYQLYTFQARI